MISKPTGIYKKNKLILVYKKNKLSFINVLIIPCFNIALMSNNRQIFHISAQIENGITLAAEVGLLSRNTLVFYSVLYIRTVVSMKH
jgi:hypothetical protein